LQEEDLMQSKHFCSIVGALICAWIVVSCGKENQKEESVSPDSHAEKTGSKAPREEDLFKRTTRIDIYLPRNMNRSTEEILKEKPYTISSPEGIRLIVDSLDPQPAETMYKAKCRNYIYFILEDGRKIQCDLYEDQLRVSYPGGKENVYTRVGEEFVSSMKPHLEKAKELFERREKVK
jgi:hypothetical protein